METGQSGVATQTMEDPEAEGGTSLQRKLDPENTSLLGF